MIEETAIHIHLEDRHNHDTPYLHTVVLGPFALEGNSYPDRQAWEEEKADLHPKCKILYEGHSYNSAIICLAKASVTSELPQA